MARLDDVIAYTFQADTYCPRCVIEKVLHRANSLNQQRAITYARDDAERYLDLVAEDNNIDRYDERSYDSDDFPKVVFRDSLEPDEDGNSERCGGCSCVLEEVW